MMGIEPGPAYSRNEFDGALAGRIKLHTIYTIVALEKFRFGTDIYCNQKRGR